MSSTIETIARKIATAHAAGKTVSKTQLNKLVKAVNDADDTPNADAIREEARIKYAYSSDDKIEIDDDAIVSEGDDGAFVQAWVFVANE